MFCFNASFQSLASAPQCVSLSSLPSVPLLSHNHALKTNSLYRKIGRDVIVMATGDAPAETEVPEFVKTLQDADEVSTTGIQLHQQMRCSSSYCHKSSRHGVGNEQ
ncbi:protein CURVATURE THYLAKOID 1B, chloroplastic [Trifolium repens]|nr:protein CURVATURE THYLAKOID 1B, chloroplastic [Trifolium repens]KAK2420394.1 protein CURVATURE THYLAKOID 1B, chloroplastic [Trifolium repens]KAK2420402.1 protein CURVATURE THYLAKOID 1B, chloroplastic [Trifolium repens]